MLDGFPGLFRQFSNGAERRGFVGELVGGEGEPAVRRVRCFALPAREFADVRELFVDVLQRGETAGQ
ncbi:hypothetical protein AB0M45_25210 [Nocardia sp. NPDC051787]|uniref:hypothetical protein n=1 Tax=Nocardia sp. NPDC051787 TaxID=3155415 RepID=UPI00342DFD3C